MAILWNQHRCSLVVGNTSRSAAQKPSEPSPVTANGANPLALVVPCHRVVASGGRLGGYGGGLDLKARLLALEHRRPLPGDLL